MSTKYIASNWRLPNKAGVDSYKSDNYGLTFDGSEFISAGTPLNGLNTFSLSIWAFRSTDQAQYDGIIAYQDNNSNYLKLFFNSSTDSTEIRMLVRPYVSMGDGGNTAFVTSNTGAFPLNQWVHIVVTSDGVNRMKMYINGVENIASQQNRPNTLSQTTNLTIGGDPCCGGRYFDGKLSEVAVFDYALSESQISTLYGSSSLGAGNPMALNPIAYYPLGDNSSGNPLTQPNEAVEDASVFDFDGSINQITLQSDFIAANEFSISIWLKPDDVSNNNFLGDGGSSSNFFRLSSTTQMKLKIGGNPALDFFESGGNNLTVSAWNHIFIYRDSSNNVGIFVNGQTFSSTQSHSLTLTLSTIGRATNIFYEGEMSNVALWNSDQSSEISNIYNSGVPATTYTNTPTAWYKLDQSANWDVSGSGNWTIPDASGNGNDGTSSGMTSANLVLTDLTRNLPYDSYSFNFDSASSDYIDCGNPTELQFTDSFSISGWFKSSSSSTSAIVSKDANLSGRCYLVQLNSLSTGILRFRIFVSNSSVTIDHGTGLNDNNWHHFVCVYEKGVGISLYIDNGTPGFTATTGTIDNDAVDFNIGRRGDGLNYFDGKISNLSIFNEPLTSTEVQKLYSNGMPQDLSSFTPAPVAWYPLGSNSFWNGSQWTVRDMIGSNDGTGQNIGIDGLVGDAPRSEANGTGTNMDIPTNLEGSTKWSDNNSWSINMSSTARVEDTP